MELQITQILDPQTVWEIRHCDVKTETGAEPAYKFYKEIEYKLDDGQVVNVPTCKCRDEYDNPEKGFKSALYYNLVRELKVEDQDYKTQADKAVDHLIELSKTYKRVKIYHPSLYVSDGDKIRDYIITKIRHIIQDYEKLREFDKVVRIYE